MKVLGLNAYELTSSVAIVEDGNVLFAECEERLSRIKRHKCFPTLALESGLRETNLSIPDFDAISLGWNPGVVANKVNDTLGMRPRELYFFKLFEEIASRSERGKKFGDWTMIRSAEPNVPDIYFVKHHISHAANAIYQSPFEKCDFLTLDFKGEVETGTYGRFNGKEMFQKEQSSLPNSVGAYYATYTQLLGYRSDSDEWKVMALATAPNDARKVNEYSEKIRSTISKAGISPRLDSKFYNTLSPWEDHLYTKNLPELLDRPDSIETELPRNWQIDVACAMQNVICDYVMTAVRDLGNKHQSPFDNICLSGGFFMNCVFNGELDRSGLYKNVFISQSPADLGNAIGSAMYVCENILSADKPFVQKVKQSLYTGQSLSDDPSTVLSKYQITYKNFDDRQDLANKLCSYVREGKVISIIEGKSEFGERALGHRSIIANPSDKTMKDTINAKIKYREDYRPFAPICLQSKASKYFEVDPGYICESMEKVVFVRKKWRRVLSAINHFDNSARLQTIEDSDSSLIVDILKLMPNHGLHPILINTSFNLNGEPIVESIEDAIRTFYTSGLDILVIENCIVEK